MSVLQRVRLISGERLDLPDALNFDAFGNADWSQFVDQFLTGASSPLIVSGFDIPSPDTYVTKKVSSVLVNIANSMMFHPESVGGAGGFFVASGSEPQQTVALTPSQTNFIELDQSTSTGGSDTRAIWDEAGGADGTGEEFKETIDTVTNLTVIASVNTVGFTAGKVPIAKVVVDANGVVTSITDCRNLMFRLGTGGTSPDATYRYGWPQGRTDHGITLTTTDPTANPFRGSDKAIQNFKTWANAVMSRLAELQGPGAKWFEGGSTGSGSLSDLFSDSVGSILTSKTGTGEFQWNGAGNTLTWTDDLEVRSVDGPYFFTIKASSATLNAGDVAYVTQMRNLPFPGASDTLAWSNGATFVNGNVLGGSFAGLESDTTSAAGRGDWIKKDVDGIHRYVRILDFYDAPGGAGGGGALTTAALAVSVELVSAYAGATGNAQGVYSKGAYTVTAGPAANVAFNTNVWWLGSRWGTPTGQCYTRDGFLMKDSEHRIVGYALTDKLLSDVATALAGRLSSVTIGDGVSSSGDYNGTTQAVFTSALAALPSGGTIFVKRGTYTFASKIQVSTAKIRIVGEGPDSTLITGAIAGDAVIELNAASCELSNLGITQSSATTQSVAVSISNSASKCKVLDNVIQLTDNAGVGTTHAIRLHKSSGNSIRRNRIRIRESAGLPYGVSFVETFTSTGTVQANQICDNVFETVAGGGASPCYIKIDITANAGGITASFIENDISGNQEDTSSYTGTADMIRLSATKTAGTAAVIQNNTFFRNSLTQTFGNFYTPSTSGAGAAVTPNTWAGNVDVAAVGSPQRGLECTDGSFKIDSAGTYSNPANSTAPSVNELRAKNIPKSWGTVTTNGGGGVSVDDGFNCTATINGTAIRITFPTPMTNANYAPVVTAQYNAAAYVANVNSANKTTGYFEIVIVNMAGAVQNPAVDALVVHFHVHGAQ